MHELHTRIWRVKMGRPAACLTMCVLLTFQGVDPWHDGAVLFDIDMI